MQTEKPGISPEQLAACVGLPSAAGVTVSGGQFENFREGWARNIMSSGKRAHWFTRDKFASATALCGADAAVRWLHGPGNYERCARCDAVRLRKPRR